MENFEVPKGWEVKSQTDDEVTLVKKGGLPKRWEELKVVAGEYIDLTSMINPIIARGEDIDYWNRNIIPKSVGGNAVLHLIMLLQLRDRYNDGWVPDWNDGIGKWCIYPYGNEIGFNLHSATHRVFAFNNKVLANEFLDNFRDYLEIAKPLL